MILAASPALLSVTSVIGMLIFLTVFLGVVFWVATRSRRQVNDWSRLPLDDK
ncbi:Cbb3-type cytochrome oxidase component FixQ [Posidoniimonas corsicana]|uniref:Cbb3-type cytochrome oxidase component FixQ n=1 Tax=Posidoniimonas corsicana TaxID=1938618 RepID=A0A5C5USN8_9BACT|nr:cbb3-type cytochrome c oxidase subunit 3 [Posidoniimonas corsicana]TWT29394.1 Cbb3-type cytochrome oxidase component FixQ [Posidoniimonas corsicana]